MSRVYPLVLTQSYQLMVRKCYSSILTERLAPIGNICLHKGGPLSEGKVEKKYDGYYVTCPWHGWEYNVKTGAAPPWIW